MPIQSRKICGRKSVVFRRGNIGEAGAPILGVGRGADGDGLENLRKGVRASGLPETDSVGAEVDVVGTAEHK